MKTITLLLATVTLTICAATIFAESPTPTPSASADAQARKYTCPMHPEVVEDKPGKCSKCGMTLVPKKEEKPKK